MDRLVAAIAWFDGVDSSSASADECARLLLEGTAEGWWYTAELPGRRRIAAFLTDPDLLGGATLEAWRRRLRQTEHVRRALPTRGRPGRFLVRPAESAILSSSAGAGWAAVGEAALALDPVSGSGLRCVFDDAVTTAEAVTEALEGDGDALAAREETLSAFFQRYLIGRREIYGQETRWSRRRFWRRRRAPLAARLTAASLR